MKHRVWIAFLCLAAVTAGLAAQMPVEPAFRTYGDNSGLQLLHPACEESALSGYLNPALLAALQGMDVTVVFSGAPETWSLMPEMGIFTAVPFAGIGAVGFTDPDGRRQIDFRYSLGMGSRSFALGVSNQGIWLPDSSRLELFRAIGFGAMVRPWRFLSIGLAGTALYSGGFLEGSLDVGIRPLGSDALLVFGNYSANTVSVDMGGAWRVGAAVEPFAGLRISSAFSSEMALGIGMSLDLGAAEIGTDLRFTAPAAPRNVSLSARSTAASQPSLMDAFSEDGRYYLQLDLRAPVSALPGVFGSRTTILALSETIRKARMDNRISGIAVNASAARMDRETLWELRTVLEGFKSAGKRVVVFMDNADLALYHFASVADRIVMDPFALLELRGFAVGGAFFKGALEKLGLGYQDLRFFTYKTAGESFSRDSFSEANREQYGLYIEDMYRATKEDILRGRGLSSAAFETALNELFRFTAGEAVGRGLVDSVGRWEEVKRVVKELEGSEKGFITRGVGYGGSGPLDALATPILEDYVSDRWGEPSRIAVIYAIGATSLDSDMRAREVARDIQRAAMDWNIKAIVLRVDSPGGDAIAADYVAEAVKWAKKKKPVIVSMGSVAGSGGYWVSMYASHIVASPYTLTGSIGVIASWFYDNGLEKSLGVSTDILQIGKHADMGSGFIFPHRALTEEEIGRIKSGIMVMYSEFVKKAAEGRGKTPEDIEKIAQGRVWSGAAALELGLVDSIGGLPDAIGRARELAKIPPDEETEIIEYGNLDFFSSLASLVPGLSEALRGGASTLAAEVADALDGISFRIARNGQPVPMMMLEDMPGH